jgi:chorismate mutase
MLVRLQSALPAARAVVSQIDGRIVEAIESRIDLLPSARP